MTRITDRPGRLAAVALMTLLVGVATTTPAGADAAPTTAIQTTVVDADTGAPVPGVCLITATASNFRFGDGCPHVSGATGAVTIELSQGGEYQLFAWPTQQAAGYGAQWVGHDGGTGSQLRAARIEVTDGQTVTAPEVLMDPARAVAGTVSGPDGTAVDSGRVTIGDDALNVGTTDGWTAIDQEGQYTFDVLGPYEWPLKFRVSGLPAQYSGQAVSRHQADTVPVVAGQTHRYDYQLADGTAVTISDEELPDAVIAKALNLHTGDQVGAWLLHPEFGVLTVPVLGAQPVKIKLLFGSVQGFVGGDDFTSATTFVIRPHAEQEITLR